FCAMLLVWPPFRPTRGRPASSCGHESVVRLKAVAEYRIVIPAIEEQVLPLVRAEVASEVIRGQNKIREAQQVHGRGSAIEIRVDGTCIAEIEGRLCDRRQVVVAVRGIDEGREALNDARVAGWK